jgi:hypothetical protein
MRRKSKSRIARLFLETLETRNLLAPLSFASILPNVEANEVITTSTGGPIVVNAQVPDNTPVTVALRDNPGQMQLTGTVTQFVQGGKATFNNLVLIGGTPAQGFSLLAFAPGFGTDVSNTFQVKPGALFLNISTPLNATTAGQPLGDTSVNPDGTITVQVLEVDGTVNKSADGTVSLFIDKNPGGAQFVDKTGKPTSIVPVKLKQGLATFTGVRLDRAGSGYTLGAAMTADPTDQGSIQPAASSPFDIVPGTAAGVTFQVTTPEITSTDPGDKTTSTYAPLANAPALPGTVSGTVYAGSTPVQTFTVNTHGDFTFTDIGTPAPHRAISAGSSINLATGVITLAWNSPAGLNHLVVNDQSTPAIPVVGVNQPINMGGRNPPFAQGGVRVFVTDSFGNFVGTDSIASVTVALGNHPNGAILGGQTTVTASGGVAYFNSLTINTASPAYTLTATATESKTTLAASVSNSFDVVPNAPNKLHFLPLDSVTSETTSTDPGTSTTSVYAALTHTPLFAGTITGTVYIGTTPIQTFSINTAGVFTFKNVAAPPPILAVSAGSSIDLTTRVITVTWNQPAGPNHLVVNFNNAPVTNESTSTESGGTVSNYAPLAHSPVLAGTVSGQVFVGSTAIQNFTVDATGVFTFTDIGSQAPIHAVTAGSSISLGTGEIIIAWSGTVGANHLVVNYQYNISAVAINGKLPTLQVEVDDAMGNKVADNTSRIKLNVGGVYGTTIVTAVNGVATFDNVFFGRLGLTNEDNKQLQIRTQFNELALGEYGPLLLTLVPGKPDHLGFQNPVIDNYVAGGQPAQQFLTAGGQPIKVFVQDISGNTVPVDNYTISMAILQVAPNSLATLIGQGPDPLDKSTLKIFQPQQTVQGVATFSQLYVHQAGSKYQLSVGTANFFDSASATSKPPGFTVSVGAPKKIGFVVAPPNLPNTNPPTIRVTSRLQITGGTGTPNTQQLTAGVTDAVGNLITTDNGRMITMTMPVFPAGHQDDLKSSTGSFTVPTINGIAIFNTLFIDQNTTGDLGPYRLQATTPGLDPTDETNPITVAAPSSNALLPNHLQLMNSLPTSPIAPGTVIPLTYTVSNTTTPTNYTGAVQIYVRLVFADTGLPTSINFFGLNGTPNVLPVTDSSNTVNFTNLSVSVPGTYKIQAYTDYGAVVDTSAASFTVAGPTSLLAAPSLAPQAITPPPPDPHTVQVGLGSYIQNFDYYTSLPVYPTIPGNAPPSNTNGQQVQPNVTLANPLFSETTNTDAGTSGTSTYNALGHLPILPGSLAGIVYVGNTAIQTFTVSASGVFTFTDISTPAANRAISAGSSVNVTTGVITLAWNNPPGTNHLGVTYQLDAKGAYLSFNQVPQSTKWWSSLMFQRSPVGTGTKGIPSDSKGNQLYSMYPDPFATMVNSNSGQSTPAGPYDFAGLGLTRLTHLFVEKATQFVDAANTQPNPLYPGNDQFFYSYKGLAIPDPRLYQDLSIGLAGVQGDASVLGYSDWTATFNWSDPNGVPKLQATLGEGLPYAYFTASFVDPTNGTPMQIVTGNPNWQNVSISAASFDTGTGQLTPGANHGTGAFQLTISYDVPEKASPNDPTPITVHVRNTYGIYLPPGVDWTLSPPGDGGIRKITFNLKTATNYFSVATLPDDSLATFNTYRQHAYSFVTGSTTNFSYDDSTGKLTTTYALQTKLLPGVGTGVVDRPLQALYVNLYQNVDPSTPFTPYSYNVARGPMKVYDGAVFVTQLQHHGTLPSVPPVPDGSQADLWHNYLYPFLLYISSGGPNDGSLNLSNLLPKLNNNYNDAQSMLGAAQLVPLLQEVSTSADPGLSNADRQLAGQLARQVFQMVKDHMSAWLSADDDQAPFLLYYQPSKPFEAKAPPDQVGWQALLTLQSGHLSSESLNDQNLIGGYFLKTAAILAQYDRYWGDSELEINNGKTTVPGKYGDLIDLMVKEVANDDRTDTMFPFLRNFDVFQGHSWADGAANNDYGTNQESSSESLNFASGLIAWGEAVHDPALRNLGIFLYDTEVNGAQTYYFDVNPASGAFPDAFRLIPNPNPPPAQIDDRPLLPVLRNGQSVVGGFIGTVQLRFAGIQMLPLSGGAYYLGDSPTYVQTLYNWASENTTPVNVPPIAVPKYLSFLYPYLALNNPDQALALYKDGAAKGQISPINPGQWIDTNAFNIHWIEGLQQYGQVDTSFHADTVSYMVFSKTHGDKTTSTFVAYNPDALPRLVHFFDATGTKVFEMTVPGRTEMTSNFSRSREVLQTTPDFSLPTPSNRFFLSSKGGNNSLIEGRTGTGQQKITLPADHSPVKFVLTGVDGTLTSSDAREAYSLYVDPTFLTVASPFVTVQFTYQNGDGSPAVVILYTHSSLSQQPGFVEVNSSVGVNTFPGAGIFHPLKLTNATITVEVFEDLGTTPIFLRTDAVAEQGRVSFVDLPYHFTKINGQAVNQDPPASPAAAAPPAASFVATPAATGSAGSTGTDPSGNTYQATLDGVIATFTGDAASDSLVFGVDADGNLTHNRFDIDPGFASPEDFDSTVPGVQPLAANSSSVVIVDLGSGTESVTLGTPTSPASSLLARFFIHHGVAPSVNDDTLRIDDSAMGTRVHYSVTAGAITSSDDTLFVQWTGEVFGGGISLVTGRRTNEVHVLGTHAGETLTLDTIRGLDVVTIGNGSVQGILGNVIVSNTNAFSDVIVDNSQAADFSPNVFLSDTQITGLAPATLSFDPNDINDLEVLGGTSPGTYHVTASIAASFVRVVTNGADTVVVGDNGVINDNLFPGDLDLEGNGNSVVRFDNSAGVAKSLSTTESGLLGLLVSDVDIAEFADVTVALGTGANSVTMASPTLGVGKYTFQGGPDTNALTFDATDQAVRAVPGSLTAGDSQTADYTRFQATNVNNAGAVNAFYGPNTADRASALQGLSANERFVQVLYLDALGRAGSLAEIDGWAALFGRAGQTQAQTQAAIATGIEHSGEGRDHLVKAWYVAYLGRQADGSEERPFVNLLLGGQSEEQVLSLLLGSGEFYQRAQSQGFGDTPDGNYVRALYQVLLNRTASTGEVLGWVSKLAGMGRSGVALAILQSQEFRTYDFEGYYNALLHRPSDAVGLNNWVMSNLDVGTVRIGFEASPEFFLFG